MILFCIFIFIEDILGGNVKFLKCFNLFNNYFDWSCDYIGFIYFNIICNM